MIYVDNFFTRAKPDEVLFECSNDFTTVQTMAQSFLYHVKGDEKIDKSCATDEERQSYKRLALTANDPIDFIEQIKMMPKEKAVRELQLNPTH
ncbi:hypothetical protein BCT19_01240 [Vibrio splendidus]|uniref:hypothetical protein n=1 Tax=Vibrio splendidus TaxID=29497 RepID=UPI000C84F62F|nr:hypothetical protein [Vibrio splendidus]PMO04336.1 hypothetical protein BCT19_01240 [Vibrio splendidus]